MGQKVQFLRSSTVSENKSSALIVLKSKLKASENNGEPIISMYYDGEGKSQSIRCLLGIVTKDGNYSIFEPTDEILNIIDANEEATSAALSKINTDVQALEDAVETFGNEYLKTINAEDETVTVSSTTNNNATIKVNIDDSSLVLDESNGYIYVNKVDGGDY